MRRIAALALLLCAVGAGCNPDVGPETPSADGAPGRRLQQAAGSGVACDKLVDTDAPEEWVPVAQLDALDMRLAAHALLQHWWGGSGNGTTYCGQLTASPDADVFVLGACTKADLTAMLLFAQYKCNQQVFGVKLVGAAKRLSGKDPRAGQVAEVDLAPSSGTVQQPTAAAAVTAVHVAATGKVTRSGKKYARANFAATGPGSASYKTMLAKTNKTAARVFLKSRSGTWRVIRANPASLGTTYKRRPKGPVAPPERPSPPPPLKRRPPPKKAAKSLLAGAPTNILPPAGPPPSPAPQSRNLLQQAVMVSGSPAPRTAQPLAVTAAASPTCDDITGAPGAYADVTGTVPPAMFTDALQAAFLMWYSQIEAGITAACPLVKTGGKVDLSALQADVMTLCRKEPQAGDSGTYYGLRFTAYLPCVQAEGRYAVLEAVVLQPEPRFAAAFEVREVTTTASTTSATGLGWGADVGYSKRLRVAVSFTRVSPLVPLDIAVDPSDPSNVWALGPVNYLSTSSACGQPFGGPLLKWSTGAGKFVPMPGISAAGMRVTVLPETHMPWIVDGCGQLRGWTASKKKLFGPPPQTKTFFDIAAAGGKVHSGCGSYNPATFIGDIAGGCNKQVAVGPNNKLAVAEPPVVDVAVTASGLEIWLEAGLTYADPTFGRRVRVVNELPGMPLRLAAGADGAIWLVVAGEGVYRGYTYNPAQPSKPNLPKTCGDVDPWCADGGCNSGLTACLRCAADAVMRSNGQCRPKTCADVDPNCAECWEGLACRRCKAGYVRGYHSGDTRCRPVVTGTPRCYGWNDVTARIAFPNSTWQSLGTDSVGGGVAAVTTQGRAYTNQSPELGSRTRVVPGNNWQTATAMGDMIFGIDNSGRVLHPYSLPIPDIPSDGSVVALAAIPKYHRTYLVADIWYVTTAGIGYPYSPYDGGTSTLALSVMKRFKAVCAGNDFACFLTASGRAVCATCFSLSCDAASIVQPGGQEPLVELVCGPSGPVFPRYACGLTISGDVKCFGPGAPLPRKDNLKFKSLATVPNADISGLQHPLVCGITTAGELRCWWNAFERTFGPANATFQMLAANRDMFCSINTSE